jgi:hypothetical protein
MSGYAEGFRGAWSPAAARGAVTETAVELE